MSMLSLAYIISRDEMRRRVTGARAEDPVLPERVPTRRRRRSAAGRVK
jgi:hypothetical protein